MSDLTVCKDELKWLGATWPESQWPEWVPQAVRDQVEDFWGEGSRRAPGDWIKDQQRYEAPGFGAHVALPLFNQHNDTWIYAEGRYVHAWNNIGRIVHADGTFSYVWLPGGELEPRVTIRTAMRWDELTEFMAAHVVGKGSS